MKTDLQTETQSRGCVQRLVRHLQRWWYELRPQYRTVEGRATTYEAADKMIRETAHLEDPNRWDIWPEREDHNRQIGVVYIRRRERIGVPNSVIRPNPEAKDKP